MTDVLWVIVGIFIGSVGGILTISLITAGKTEDLYVEIQDLRTQRQLLKEEIHRLNKPRSKPTPRKKRNYKPKSRKQ
tara:strand:+ start:312 stop:542 length:231 start_codon:yes stop_codon:yes gene_type:complete